MSFLTFVTARALAYLDDGFDFYLLAALTSTAAHLGGFLPAALAFLYPWALVAFVASVAARLVMDFRAARPLRR